MPDTGKPAQSAPKVSTSDPNLVELNMRRALGLTSGGNGRGGAVPQQRADQARGRHRFAQDGSVPVTVLNHRPDELSAKDARIAELQASLENERNTHANTRRTLSEQQAAHQALQTRLAHMELAHRDALEAERRTLAVAQSALADAKAQPTPRRAARPAAEPVAQPEAEAGAEVGAEVGAGPGATAVDGPAAPAAPKAKRGRPRIHPPREPKPLRWWTPSFKAKTKA